jgi:hypothetical protein
MYPDPHLMEKKTYLFTLNFEFDITLSFLKFKEFMKKTAYCCPRCLDFIASQNTSIACLWVKLCYDCSSHSNPFEILNPSQDCEENLKFLEDCQFLRTGESMGNIVKCKITECDVYGVTYYCSCHCR